jgi:hypothetical protein
MAGCTLYLRVVKKTDMNFYYNVRALLLLVIAVAVLALIFRGCRKKTRIIEHYRIQNHMIFYKDKDGKSHGATGVRDIKEAPDAVIKTGKAIAGSKKKIESVTGVGIVYPCDSTVYTIPDSLIEKWSREGIPDTIRIPITAREIKDSLQIIQYWKQRQLMIDIKSEKGTITGITSYKVYKRPRLGLGPSITVVYYNGLRALPGLSIVYDILPRRKR